MILAKLVIVAIIALAASGMVHAGLGSNVDAALAGIALMGLAIFAPWTLLRLLPLMEAAVVHHEHASRYTRAVVWTSELSSPSEHIRRAFGEVAGRGAEMSAAEAIGGAGAMRSALGANAGAERSRQCWRGARRGGRRSGWRRRGGTGRGRRRLSSECHGEPGTERGSGSRGCGRRGAAKCQCSRAQQRRTRERTGASARRARCVGRGNAGVRADGGERRGATGQRPRERRATSTADVGRPAEGEGEEDSPSAPGPASATSMSHGNRRGRWESGSTERGAVRAPPAPACRQGSTPRPTTAAQASAPAPSGPGRRAKPSQRCQGPLRGRDAASGQSWHSPARGANTTLARSS